MANTALYTGGLIGKLERGTVERVQADVQVTSERTYAGCLIGRNISGEVSYASATGNVEGYNGTGGLIGGIYYGSPSITGKPTVRFQAMPGLVVLLA